MFPINHPVFDKITQEEYDELISCGGIRTVEYKKGTALFQTGDQTEEFGILLSGKINIENSTKLNLSKNFIFFSFSSILLITT